MLLIRQEPRWIMDLNLYKGSVDSSKKDEGELTVGKRLLSRVTKAHKHTIDIVVYDALACNSSWINHCTTNKVISVIHGKDNNITSIKEVKTRINKSNIKEIWQDERRECEVKAYEETFKIGKVTDSLRFVKFSKKTNQGKYSQERPLYCRFS